MKAIVYGLGRQYEKDRQFIESEFDIIGYSDKEEKDIPGFIKKEEINNYDFDYIYITSLKYANDIKRDLSQYVGGEQKCISKEDIWGKIGNPQVRNEWVEARLAEIPNGLILLDAGAGEMQYKKYCKKLKYIAQDFGEYVPFQEGEGLHPFIWDTSEVDIISDIINIPLEDNFVDVILCTEVFEHIKNPILAIKEFSRILKPGGKLLLTAPFCSITHMAPYYYQNGFSKYWYREILKDYKFKINEETSYGNYFAYIIQELFRVSEVAKRYCDRNLSREETKLLSDTIKMLSSLSKSDSNSEELLCFGWMIEATKNKNV